MGIRLQSRAYRQVRQAVGRWSRHRLLAGLVCPLARLVCLRGDWERGVRCSTHVSADSIDGRFRNNMFFSSCDDARSDTHRPVPIGYRPRKAREGGDRAHMVRGPVPTRLYTHYIDWYVYLTGLRLCRTPPSDTPPSGAAGSHATSRRFSKFTRDSSPAVAAPRMRWHLHIRRV